MLDYFKRKVRLLSTLTVPPLHSEDEEGARLLRTHQDGAYPTEPLDNCHIVYWIFFLYGIAMLLPWNVFITASEYFAARFAGSPYQENFQSYFSTYFTITNLAIFVFILWRQSKSNAIQIDVLYPILLNSIIFGIMSVTVETSFGGSGYFWLTLTLLVLTGATTSFFQVAVFAEASRFPAQYVQAVMSGQGIAGVVVAASSVLSALAAETKFDGTHPSTSRSAFIYFLSALLVTIAALVGRVLLSQQAFYVYQMSQDKAITSDNETGGSDDDDNDEQRQQQQQQPHQVRSVFEQTRKSAGLVFAVGYVFVITLMIFPSITAMIKSVTRHPPTISNTVTGVMSRFLDDDIFVAMHFLLFNVGDWLGRLFPLWSALRTYNPTLLVIFSSLRTLFVPLFLVCNVVISTERSLPVLIDSDTGYFLLVLAFSLSNGWVSSLSMMAAPQQSYLRNGFEKSQIGSIMSFSLVVGLAIGGSMSFWLRSFV